VDSDQSAGMQHALQFPW